MTELEYSPEDQLVSWKDANGEQVDALLPEIFLRYGVDPEVFKTSAEKSAAKQQSAMDMEEHKQKMKAKYGTATANRPAVLQTADWIQANIKDENGKPLTPEKAWKMANSGRHSRELLIAKIAGQISAENRANFTEMTAEELREEVGKRMSFIDAFADNKQNKPKPNPAIEPASPTGTISRDGPSGYSDLWK